MKWILSQILRIKLLGRQSHKKYRPLVNPPNKVWIDSIQTKTPTSLFQIGDYLIYTNEGHNEMVELVDINTNEPDSTKYRIKIFIGNKMLVTKEFL